MPALPNGLGSLAAADGPDGLLLAAAALGAWRMAGRVPDPSGADLVELMQESRSECSDGAAAQLEFILSNQGPRTQVCREWCRLAAAAGVRAPAGLAACLFAYARKLDWAAEAGAVLGARLHWLRGLDGSTATEVAEADWSGPDLPRRAAALRLLRADPAAGRAALAAAWKTEPADARARLLAAVETGLSGDDEPFLEERLDDRSAQVRAEAARLLAGLPGSRRAVRMQERARAAVQVRRGGFLSRAALIVALPAGDDAARRDGLDAKGAGAGTALLGQLAAAAPLSSWDGAAPERWVKLALAGDWAEALVPGWAAAAVRERDAAWLAVLLGALIAVPKPTSWIAQTLGTIAPALPSAELERAALSTLRGGPQQPGSLMQACAHDWSPRFTQGVMDWLSSKPAAGAGSDYSLHYAMKSVLDLLAVQGSVDAAGRLSAMQARLPDGAAPMLRRAFDDAAATLSFRQAMHQEFAR